MSFSRKFLPRKKKNIFWLQNGGSTYTQVNTVFGIKQQQIGITSESWNVSVIYGGNLTFINFFDTQFLSTMSKFIAGRKEQDQFFLN